MHFSLVDFSAKMKIRFMSLPILLFQAFICLGAEAKTPVFCFQLPGFDVSTKIVRWTESDLLYILSELNRKGFKLYASHFRSGSNLALEAAIKSLAGYGVTGYGFYKALNRQFGNLESAILKIGLNPQDHNAQIIWNEKEILDLFRYLMGKLTPLSQINVRRNGNALIEEYTLKRFGHEVKARGFESRVIAIFGSWDAALIAAGLNPENIRLVPPKMEWTTTKFFKAMRALEDHQIPLNFELLASDRWPEIRPVLQEALDFPVSGGALVQAGRSLFGSWVKARKKYLDRKSTELQWSRELVTRWIQYLLSIRMKVDQASIESDFTGLYSMTISLAAGKVILGRELVLAGERLFGSWRQALLRTSLVPDSVALVRFGMTTRALEKMKRSDIPQAQEIQLLTALEEILFERGPISQSIAAQDLSRRLERPVTTQELQATFRIFSQQARGYE